MFPGDPMEKRRVIEGQRQQLLDRSVQWLKIRNEGLNVGIGTEGNCGNCDFGISYVYCGPS